MSDLDHLVAAVCLDPADLPRLVLADYLEERDSPGDAARAELIRVGCEIAAMGPPRIWMAHLTEVAVHRDNGIESRVVSVSAWEDPGAEALDFVPLRQSGPRMNDLRGESVTSDGNASVVGYAVALKDAPPWPRREECAPLILLQEGLLSSLGYRPADYGESFWTNGGEDFSVERGFPAAIRMAYGSRVKPVLPCHRARVLSGWPVTSLVVVNAGGSRLIASGGPSQPIFYLALAAGHPVIHSAYSHRHVELSAKDTNAFCFQHLNKTRLRQIADGTFRANLL